METYVIELINGETVGNVGQWRDVLEHIERGNVQRIAVHDDGELQYYIDVNAPQPQPVQLAVERWDTARECWVVT